MGLPALFLAIVVWIIARMTVLGEMSIGEFVAVFGYVAVLVVPVAALIEGAIDIHRALVSAQRTIAFLAIPAPSQGTDPVADPTAALVDPASGLTLRQGQFAAVVPSDRREAAALIERLSGLEPSGARWGAQRLDEIASTPLRASILPLDDSSHLFADTVQEVVFSQGPPEQEHRARIAAAAGIDEIVRGLDRGWETPLRDRAHELSGGQRQRIRLARALALDPPFLLALDPLSAVDAITETRVVQQVRALRGLRTTLIVCDSVTVVAAADIVHVLDHGRIVLSGTHANLSASNAAYRQRVSRDADGGPEPTR